MSSRKLRKGDVAWVRSGAGFLDLLDNTLVQVIGTEPAYTIVRPLLYAGGYSKSGYYMSDSKHHDPLQLIELEAPDGAQADVPVAEGELPHAGRGESGDAPPVPERTQPPGSP